MTAVSTVLAMGMLPLNLLIYSRSWTDEPLIIPYVNILISFGLTLGPALLGIFIRWKFPKVADVLVKVWSYYFYVYMLMYHIKKATEVCCCSIVII